MGMVNLDKIKLGHSGLTDTIYLYRHGKDPVMALDKREADGDVMSVFVQKMMYGAPKGATMNLKLGDEYFVVSCKPIEASPIAEQAVIGGRRKHG